MPMKCKICQFENPEGMSFCGKCGNPLMVECPVCRHQNPAGFQYCSHCNKEITHSDKDPVFIRKSALEYTPRFLLEKALKHKASMVGERKLVSVLFADVADFTTIAEKMDPEDVHEIMDAFFGILGREIHRAGGTINQYTGDGIMALFGAPIAFDDHIQPACRAALRIQMRMKEFYHKIFARYGVHFKLRIGIHTGPVVVGAIGDNLRLDYTALGDTTNLAARLESMAEPGKILVSKRVFENAKGRFLFQETGYRPVKGKEKPVQVFLLLRELSPGKGKDKYASSKVPFVDRKKEISLLKKAFKKTIEEGPVIVAVTGEAGIGKTRLIKKFHGSLNNQKRLFLEGRCAPYGQLTALFPLKQIFRSYFNLNEQDSDQQVELKINNMLKETGQCNLLAHFLDLFANVEKKIDDFHFTVDWNKKVLFRAIRALLASISKKQPLIIVINDIQWIDASTREFLAFLVNSSESIPVLAICSGKSRTDPLFSDLSMEQIQINPLSQKHAMDLFISILKNRYFDSVACKAIVSRAGGNPLFLVEMVESLKRQGLIVCDESKCTLKVPVQDIKTPDSIQGILTARLDALGPEKKHLTQLASVIGSKCSLDLLEPLYESPEKLSDLLDEMVKEGIFEQVFFDNRQHYQFKQQLMQEVAYNSLLRRDCRRYHQLAGQTIETLYKGNLHTRMGLLAHHFYKAKNWSKALGYTLEAMEQAGHTYACHEALVSIDRALDIISKGQWERSTVKILDLFLRKGKFLFCMGQMDAARKVFKKLLHEARRSHDHETEAKALFRLGWISFYLHQPRSARTLLAQAINLGKQKGFSEILLKATGFLGFVYAVLGNLEKAKHLLTESFQLGEKLEELDGKAWSLVNLARYYNWTGEFKKTLELTQQIEIINRKIRSPYFRILLYFIQGSAFGALGQVNLSKKNLTDGLKQLEEVDDKFWRPRFLNTLGWVHAETGEYQEALRLNRQSLDLSEVTGDPETKHNAKINMGENYLGTGNLVEAKKTLEEVWLEVRKSGISYARWRYKTRLLIDLGELYGRMGNRSKGLAFNRKAINLAQKSGAKKHLAMALLIRGQLISRRYPNLIKKSFNEALTLSLEMGTRRLTEKILQAQASCL